ncbi:MULTISPECIES: RDD family protein [Streptomonospora]|uniref:RDD family protein n=2 Tax=Streptomonospora TaxID=104204 RepID=A0ABV9SJ87_9ACTN
MSDPYGPPPYPPGYGPSGHYPGAAPPPPPPPGPYAASAPYSHGPAAPVHPPPASWPARAVAYLIDGFIASVIFLVLFYGAMGLGLWLFDPDSGGSGEAAMIVTMLVMLPLAAFASFCYTWIPHARSGRTLGKRAAGVKVILMKTGQPPSLGLSAGRQLVAVALASVTCVGTLLDLLWPLWDEPYRQAVHDKAVGTRVIRVRGEGAGPYPVHPQAARPHPGAMPAPPGTGGWY